MPRPLRRFRLEQLIPFVLAAAIFAFACGSSSVVRVQDAGRPARWVLLFVLLALAVVAAYRAGGPPRLPVPVLGAAAVFAVLALASTMWSVDPRLTFERAATFAVMLATVAGLAQASVGDRLSYGVVGGAAAVALAGLVVLAVRHSDAVQAATRAQPTRYQGLGQDPNTVSLLLAPCLALVVWLFVRAPSRRRRIALGALALLFDGSIIASGSRGALIAAFAGVGIVVVLLPAPIRTRAALTAAAAAALAASIAIALTPKTAGLGWRPPAVARAPEPGSHPKPGYLNVEAALPLDSDIGRWFGTSKPATRTLFGLSGRGEAWRGAIDLGNERPLVGYGFGTEGRVFVDRWVNFAGGLPEDSYVGTYLQLGAAGLVALGLLLVLLVRGAVRRAHRWEIAGPVATLAAGLGLAVVQSYLYSVGDIATLVVWTAAFVAAAQPLRERVRA